MAFGKMALKVVFRPKKAVEVKIILSDGKNMSTHMDVLSFITT